MSEPPPTGDGAPAAKPDERLFTLRIGNESMPQAVAVVSSVGAALVSMQVPDANGRMADVALGLATDDAPSAADRAAGRRRGNSHYLGVVVGRVANRVRDARLVLAGADGSPGFSGFSAVSDATATAAKEETFSLDANCPPHTLHGGWIDPPPRPSSVGGNAPPPRLSSSWGHLDWTLEGELGTASVTLALASPDGHGGWPGAVRATATYTLLPGLGPGGTCRLQINVRCAVATGGTSCPVAPCFHGQGQLWEGTGGRACAAGGLRSSSHAADCPPPTLETD